METVTRKWICTFSIENTQQGYAECLESIQNLEKIAENSNSYMEFSCDDLEFYISRANDRGVNNSQTILQQEKYLASGEKIKFKKISSYNMLIEGLKKETQLNEFYYYFRVKLGTKENDITDLQFLILLLQTMPMIRKRVAVRLMSSGDAGWSTREYFRVSHFLYFVQKKYNCFYACYNENLESLQALTQSIEGTQSTFLPLLEVDGMLCQVLNKTWLLKANYNKHGYEKLYLALELVGNNSDNMSNTLVQIGFRMLFKSFSGKKYNNDKSKQELLNFICELIQEIQGATPLDMVLFGAMAGNLFKKKPDYNEAKELFGKIQMLSSAISQILENSVNHSEHNCGVFTFRLQRNIEYLHYHYPGYSISDENNCIELLIADSNSTDSIIQHFLGSNKAINSIKERASDVRLEHFFGEYHNLQMAKVWEKARRERPEMCHGLLSFANSIRNLNGAVRVRSTPTYFNESNEGTYYYNGSDDIYNDEKFRGQMYVPGTQFSIVFNRFMSSNSIIKTYDEDWAFDFDKLVYATTYRELAQALTFSENVRELKLDEVMENVSTEYTNQAEKDNTTIYWREWFDSKIPEKEEKCRVIYLCDLQPLCDKLSQFPKLCEPFCKGFLSSRFFTFSAEKKYYGILFQNPSAMFSRIFASNAYVANMQKGFATDKVCVYFYPKRYKGDYLPYCATTLHDLLNRELKEDIFPRVFPYTLFIKNKCGHTLFEQELLKQADVSITNNEQQGFKIDNTHMRLGNKVHLDTFYEMALFFENPNYAYYTGFLFLRDLMVKNPGLFETNSKVLIYGYASYSRAIVWAILQILKQYKELRINEDEQKIDFPEVEFVIYQNDLQLETEQPQIQMYYSREEWQRNPKTIWEERETTVIMIVPISSSLTTFDKMLAELCRETDRNYKQVKNYTAFWVRNEYEDVRFPTSVEEFFWSTVDVDNRIITSNIIQNTIRYLVFVTSKWSNPLGCKKCFPEDVMLEYPLVETDPTSTVPTQQFYQAKKVDADTLIFVDNEEQRKNDERVARLKNNIVYGHVSQGTSHYQYYIKTKVYFQQERDNVAQWLQGLREEAIRGKNAAFLPNCINVLIIPQQANNVEFGQFVYEHYFQGSAECIIVNTEKEFRSNLQAEYSGLFKRLRLAISEKRDNVKFHYVDISVNTGNSFNRVVSLISSCMEEIDTEYLIKHEKPKYEFRIEQVFLLISRLSDKSKRRYVQNPVRNFHAYTEIHISSMRTFGDSCVPCKIQQEARRYYKKAATKSISSYWEKKTYLRECVPFDQVQESRLNDAKLQEKGYQRMMCAHRAAHYIHKIQGSDISSYFVAVRSFLSEILYANHENVAVPVYQEINDTNRKEWLAAGLKIVARPFFSYDYKMRCVVMDLYLLLSEYIIKGCDVAQLKLRIVTAKEKKYLLEYDNLEWAKEFADGLLKAIGSTKWEQLEFVRNNILKGLADIKSNYVLRKETMLALSQKLDEAGYQLNDWKQADEFYEHYLRSVLRITHNSSDETKSVWLEHLLHYGQEYQPDVNMMEDNVGVEQLIEAVPEKIRTAFREFVELLLVENNRPIYQAVVEYDKRKQYNSQKPKVKNSTLLEEAEKFLQEYHMRNALNFFSLQRSNATIKKQLCVLHELLLQLNTKTPNIICYQQLGKKIQKIVQLKSKSPFEVILFGKYSENKSMATEYLELPNYFILFPERFDDAMEREKSQEKKIFENRWNQIQKDNRAYSYLRKNGFYLLQTGKTSKNYDIIIMLDNNYDDLLEQQGANHQKIEPIYIFISCELKRQQALELTRMILMFRCKLTEWLENDFNNNAIAVLSEQKHLAKLLSTDKIGDHADDDFVECQQEVLMATAGEEFTVETTNKNWEYTVTYEGKRKKEYEFHGNVEQLMFKNLTETREWFFLRSYVNSRISRLFRTMIRTENDLQAKEDIDKEKYYARDYQSVMMRPVYSLEVVFFTPTKAGFIRKNYLRLIMKTVTFVVQDIPDYRDNPQADIEERLDNLSGLLKDFNCISLEQKGKKYAYLSEYLATILLDCFVSALKAGEVWNQSSWGGKAFQVLHNKTADKKCKVWINRELGGEFNGKKYDYLVIRNSIYHPLRTEKKGPGMSQAAMRWYVEGLWRSCSKQKQQYPKVVPILNECEYTVKLPILEVEGDVKYE